MNSRRSPLSTDLTGRPRQPTDRPAQSAGLGGIAGLSSLLGRSSRWKAKSVEDKAGLIRWANRHLSSHEYKPITHLEAEIADGKTLLRLVQIVVDEQLPRHFLRPQKRSQKVENLKLCLNFLKDRDCDVVGVQPEDIADGKTAAIFAVLQALKNTEEKEQQTVADPFPSTSQGELSKDSAEKEDAAVLDWVSSLVQRTIPDYSRFTDGRLLCDVVNCLHPGAINLRSVGSSLPVERIQLALAAAKRYLDVPVPQLNPRDVIFERARPQLRNFLQKIRAVAQQRSKVREEERVKNQTKRQLQAEKTRFEVREKRIQLQSERASERRRQQLLEIGELSRSMEDVVDPVENVSHQFQREQELAKRIYQAQEQPKLESLVKVNKETSEKEKADREERLKKLKEEQQARERVQQARLGEEKKRQLEQEQEKQEKLKKRRQSQQQLFLERHKQQLGNEERSSSSSGVATKKTTAKENTENAGAMIPLKTTAKSARRQTPPPSSSEGGKRQTRHQLRKGKGRGSLRRRAVSLSDFRSVMTLTPIEEERRSSGSSTPSSEDRSGRLERRASESNLIQAVDKPDPSQFINVDKAVIASMRRDFGLIKPVYEKSRDPLQDSRQRPLLSVLPLSPEQPDGTDGRKSADEGSGLPEETRWRIEERLRRLEEENEQLKALVNDERKKQMLWSADRLRLWGENRRVKIRRRQTQRKLSVAETVAVKIKNYDACLLAFARKLSLLESELVLLHQQAVAKVSDVSLSFDSSDLSKELQVVTDQVKTLSRKMESLEKGANSAGDTKTLMEELSLLKGQLSHLEGKKKRKEKLSSRPFLGKFNPLSRKSRPDSSMQSTPDMTESANATSQRLQGDGVTLHLSENNLDLDQQQYSQSAVQLRLSDRQGPQPKKAPSEDIRRRSYVKLTSFFGEEPPPEVNASLQVFLDRLGYGHFIEIFDKEQISLVELSHMSEEHLDQLGIPMGPRVIIMQEIKKHLKVTIN